MVCVTSEPSAETVGLLRVAVTVDSAVAPKFSSQYHARGLQLVSAWTLS